MRQFHKTTLTAVVLDLSTLGNIKSQMYPLPPKSREKKVEYKCQLSALKTPVLSMLQNTSHDIFQLSKFILSLAFID